LQLISHKTIQKAKSIMKNLLINSVLAVISLTILLFISFRVMHWYARQGQQIAVPDLIGVSVEDAAKKLENERLQLVLTDSVFDIPDSMRHVPPGAVLDQIPRSGSTVKPDRKIYVTIRAMGQPMVLLPDVRNMSLNLARQELTSLGFSIAGISTTDNSPPKTHRNPPVLVVKYKGKEVPAGEKVPKGSVLHLVVDPLSDEGEEDEEGMEEEWDSETDKSADF
jgi:eukaryotic-like serine/threonine-protein kinase